MRGHKMFSDATFCKFAFLEEQNWVEMCRIRPRENELVIQPPALPAIDGALERCAFRVWNI